LCAPTFAQPQTGELRLLVRDPTGSAVRASGVISSDITQVERRFTTGDNGSFIAQSLPFGLYRVSIERTGFAAYLAVVDIRSPIPLRLPITLELAPVVTTVRVYGDRAGAGSDHSRARRIPTGGNGDGDDGEDGDDGDTGSTRSNGATEQNKELFLPFSVPPLLSVESVPPSTPLSQKSKANALRMMRDA